MHAILSLLQSFTNLFWLENEIILMSLQENHKANYCHNFSCFITQLCLEIQPNLFHNEHYNQIH